MDRFFPLETRDKKILEFINLLQVNMSMKENVLRFTPPPEYASTIVAKYMVRMIEFILVVSELVV